MAAGRPAGGQAGRQPGRPSGLSSHVQGGSMVCASLGHGPPRHPQAAHPCSLHLCTTTRGRAPGAQEPRSAERCVTQWAPAPSAALPRRARGCLAPAGRQGLIQQAADQRAQRTVPRYMARAFGVSAAQQWGAAQAGQLWRRSHASPEKEVTSAVTDTVVRRRGTRPPPTFPRGDAACIRQGQSDAPLPACAQSKGAVPVGPAAAKRRARHVLGHWRRRRRGTGAAAVDAWGPQALRRRWWREAAASNGPQRHQPAGR